MDITGENGRAATLEEHAAQRAFPDWAPQADDWAHLHTGFIDDGTPYTEVSVYRAGDGGGHVRIHYRRCTGNELAAFGVAA
ncbi:hypothetical protein HD597_000519 [Nonomuraea thailandensis]|uniref:Uncharacterized protein n=1 Tax=Nonomuraea thailandensis TaxID=1188745 RepID=A0A9X2JYU5_9ACTN|nr:hypothetical protein [Nonomuraea thailandensis]MCP2353499.1 hypothetical protein [Nonomuraea thailandensis]